MFEQIAENNLKTLEDYNLGNYINSTDSTTSQEGGDLFMREYLSKEQYPLFSESADLDDIFEIKEEEELVKTILENGDIALITIRAEMLHHASNILQFLKARDLEEISSFKQKLTADQYWDIYHRGITNPEARETMATRTLVYTSNDVLTVILRDKKGNKGYTASDYLFRELKGKSGEYCPGTLRGDIIRKEAERVGLNKLDNKEVALAADPLGAYRNIIRDKQLPPDSLLKYTAVSVHIPNSDELPRDMSVLLNRDQLLSVLNCL